MGQTPIARNAVPCESMSDLIVDTTKTILFAFVHSFAPTTSATAFGYCDSFRRKARLDGVGNLGAAPKPSYLGSYFDAKWS